MLVDLNQLFQNFQESLDTKQEKLLIGFTTLELVERFRTFLNPNVSVSELLKNHSIETNNSLSIEEQRTLLRKEKNLVNYIYPYSYRLYDTRYIFAHPVFFTDSLIKSS